MMAGPPPWPHRGHTSPPEVPALPQGGGGGAGAEPSRGSLVSLYGAGQGFAQPSGHGRGDAAQTPLGVKGAPPARGTGCPRGAASISSVLIQQRRHFRGTVCKTGHPWEEKVSARRLGCGSSALTPQDDHANGLAGPCKALLIPARLGQGSRLRLCNALREIWASA